MSKKLCIDARTSASTEGMAMRGFIFGCLTVWLGVATSTFARAGEPVPNDNGTRCPQIVSILGAWDKASRKSASFHFKFTQTTEDKAFGKKHVYTGDVRVVRPDQIRIDYQPDERSHDTWVFLGEEIRWYDHKHRRASTLPAWVAEAFHPDLVLMFRGLPGKELANRFGVRLTKQDAAWI